MTASLCSPAAAGVTAARVRLAISRSRKCRIADIESSDQPLIRVDLVLEQGAGMIAVEIKASATVTPADFRGLRKLKEAAGARFTSGVVLYDGETSASFGDGLFAVPVRLLWASR